jgi:hypothetical protein
MNTKIKTQVAPVSYPHTARQRRGPLHIEPNPAQEHFWLIVWDDNDSSLFPVSLWSAKAVKELKRAKRALYFDHKPTALEIIVAL